MGFLKNQNIKFLDLFGLRSDAYYDVVYDILMFK